MKIPTMSIQRILGAVLAASFALPALAASREKLDSRARDLTDYFVAQQTNPQKAIPPEILSKAQGMIVMRNYKGGFIVGLSGGHGVAILKDPNTQQWGPIGFVKSGEGSFGFQAGAQRSDLILVLMNSDGVKVLTDPNFKIGVDIRATVGPMSGGDQANLKTDTTPVLVYGDTKGLFGGAALETGAIFPDGGDNEDYYGKKLTMSEVLSGRGVEPTDAAKQLAARIVQFAAVTKTVQAPVTAPAAAGAPLRREESMRASLTANVTAINPERREITLRSSDGKERTLTVDKDVRRFNEIKVGDNVKVEYFASLAGEVREPTAEEKQSPLTDTSVETQTPAAAAPGARETRTLKAVTKVEELDPVAKTVTIRGPRGRSVEVAVKDPTVLQRLKVGDPIVITFTEAVAVALEKQNP